MIVPLMDLLTVFEKLPVVFDLSITFSTEVAQKTQTDRVSGPCVINGRTLEPMEQTKYLQATGRHHAERGRYRSQKRGFLDD